MMSSQGCSQGEKAVQVRLGLAERLCDLRHLLVVAPELGSVLPLDQGGRLLRLGQGIQRRLYVGQITRLQERQPDLTGRHHVRDLWWRRWRRRRSFEFSVLIGP